MNNKNNFQDFTIVAQYSKSDYGSFYKDDFPNEKSSVRPSAEADSYLITKLNKEFSSPEETLLYLNQIYPNGFSLSLCMNNFEADKFIKLWKILNVKI